jgi:flagella basal body P-ring formation protein FlgA
MRNILLIVATICISPSEAAVLRNATTLHAQQVRIADLFDDAGPVGERILGPGPAPGGRIVVEAAQAAAIARQFGVAWRPNSGGERVVLDRPGRSLAREDIIATLRRALRAGGVGPEAEIELSSFTAPLVPTDAQPGLTVEQLDITQITGRFTAGIAIDVDGEPRQILRVAGQIQEMVDTVVTTRRLPAGAALREADLALKRIAATSRSSDAARSMTQVVGQALLHPINAGQPIPLTELGRPLLVQKGALVQMQLQAPGLLLSASGEAVESGGMGERIGVLNPISGAVVDAQIIGPDQVLVVQGSALRRPARANATVLSQR